MAVTNPSNTNPATVNFAGVANVTSAEFTLPGIRHGNVVTVTVNGITVETVTINIGSVTGRLSAADGGVFTADLTKALEISPSAIISVTIAATVGGTDINIDFLR
jgi:hypothetical protein